MIIQDFEMDNHYRQEPKHGIKPKCAFCDHPINILAMDNTWLWFVYKSAVHYAHSECMQENVDDDEADGFSEWLQTITPKE